MPSSNRTHTGAPALRALAKITEPEMIARWISEQLDIAGYIIVPKPYRKPVGRGRRGKGLTEHDLADAMCSGSGR